MTEPNLFNLEGDELTVSYSTSGFDGRPHLTYEDADLEVTFSGDEIEVDQSAIGTLVTVQLEDVPDLRTTTFTVLVPHVRIDDDVDHVEIDTQGIRAERRTSIAPTTLQ